VEVEMWNPRYTAYAAAHGRTELEQLDHDRAAYPGGCMTGFICWINNQWALWYSVRKLKPTNYVLDDKDHQEFDAQLAALSQFANK
jgi:hypothetical protein